MHRHQLTDEQWSIVEPLIPKKHTRTPAGRRSTRGKCLTGSCGSCEPERLGVICPSVSGRIRRFTTTTAIGVTTACLTEFCRRCRFAWTVKARSTGTCGASTARTCGRHAAPPVREKK